MTSISTKNIFQWITIWLSIHIVFPLFLFAQNSEKPTYFLINGYIKDMQTVLSQGMTGEFTNANLIHNRINIKWLPSTSFTSSLEFRNRLLTGNILKIYPGYNKSFEADRGILSLSKNLIDRNSWLLNSSIDRFWIQYSNNKFLLTAGRQRINWGQTFVWNPNDIFNNYSYFDFDYEEKPGSDAVRLQYFNSPTSVFELAIKENNQNKITFGALYRFNKWNYDIQFLGGKTDQSDLIIGTGWSGQFLKGGLRGEITYFHPEKCFSDTTGVILTSIGYDYTFKNSLLAQFEILFNSNNNTSNSFSFDQLTSTVSNTKNIFIPKLSFFGSLSYPISPLVYSSLTVIGNPHSQLLFIIPTINISLTTNFELSFTAQILRYYGSNNSQDLNMLYARLKYTY